MISHSIEADSGAQVPIAKGEALPTYISTHWVCRDRNGFTKISIF